MRLGASFLVMPQSVGGAAARLGDRGEARGAERPRRDDGRLDEPLRTPGPLDLVAARLAVAITAQPKAVGEPVEVRLLRWWGSGFAAGRVAQREIWELVDVLWTRRLIGEFAGRTASRVSTALVSQMWSSHDVSVPSGNGAETRNQRSTD